MRAWLPRLANRAEGVVSIFGGLVLAILVIALVYGIRDRFMELMAQAGPSALLLNLAGVTLGLLCSRATGLSRREALAVATELGIKNGTLGLMVTLTLLHSSEMSIPSAIYGVLMFPVGFLLAAYGRRVVPAGNDDGVPAPAKLSEAG